MPNRKRLLKPTTPYHLLLRKRVPNRGREAWLTGFCLQMSQFEDAREMQRDGETEKSLGRGSCVRTGG